MQRQLNFIGTGRSALVPHDLGRVASASLVALLALLAPAVASGQSAPGPAAVQPVELGGNLNITPKRLTFDRGERSASVYIFNQGQSPATFDIGMIDRIMLPSGEIVPVTAAKDNPSLQPIADKLNSASGMVIAAPRRAVLAPGKGQTIRIRLTAPASGTAVEYRTHLTVMTVPPRSAGLTAEEAAAAESSNQVSFQVAAIYGVSIPVIVRPGTPDVRAEIANAHFKSSPDGSAILALDLNRLGLNSVFGNIEVRPKGEKSPIAVARGVGVYPEIDKRAFEMPFPRLPRSGEQFEILYIDDDVTPGRTIARTLLVVP